MDNQLLNDGIIKLKKVFKEKNINEYLAHLGQFLQNENIYYKIINKQDYDEKYYYVNNTWSLINNYEKLYNYPKPVINKKNNKDYNIDSGIIEIYNINNLLIQTNEYFDINLIKMLIVKLLNKNIKFKFSKLELSKNNYNPNKIHRDGNNIIKFGILLSDFNNYNEGNNIFVKKSHLDDYTNIDVKDLDIIIGNKGDCVIYYEKGLHNKSVQTNNRLMINLNYYFEIID